MVRELLITAMGNEMTARQELTIRSELDLARSQ